MCGSSTIDLKKKQFMPLVESILSSDSPQEIFEYRQPIRDSGDSGGDTADLRGVLLSSVVECLAHENYEIASNSARVLRNNRIECRRYCDINRIVSRLTEQLADTRTTSAEEAAWTLAHFLSTRPSDSNLPNWHQTDPMTTNKIAEDIDQTRMWRGPVGEGFLEEISEDVFIQSIEEVSENLDRKKYKRSSNWDVAKGCASAIGAVGYKRPALVEEYVPRIKNLSNEGDQRLPYLLYALTSIGYARPDLVEDLSTFLEENSDATLGVGRAGMSVMRVGYQKIGHEPSYLEMCGSEAHNDLEPVVEKLFGFMLNCHIYSYNDVLNAFVVIYKNRSEDLMDILHTEMNKVLDGNARGHDFPHNLMRILNELSAVNADKLGPLISLSPNFYEYRPANHYWCDNALKFHYNIAVEDEDLLPDNIGEVVRKFLDGEMRASVRRNGKQFLTEIGEWNESILTDYDDMEDVTSSTYKIDLEELSAKDDLCEFED